jgi:hypothetical protein
VSTRGAGRLVAVACFMASTGATGAHSETDTNSANLIMPACEGFLAHNDHDLLSAYRQGICAGEVQGVWATANAVGRVCSPPQATVGQAVLVVMRFINARPARMHEPFSLLALEALTTAWPCKVTTRAEPDYRCHDPALACRRPAQAGLALLRR